MFRNAQEQRYSLNFCKSSYSGPERSLGKKFPIRAIFSPSHATNHVHEGFFNVTSLYTANAPIVHFLSVRTILSAFQFWTNIEIICLENNSKYHTHTVLS